MNRNISCFWMCAMFCAVMPLCAQGSEKHYAQAKQNSVVTDAGSGNPQPKREHIEHLFDKDHEVIRFIDKDGKKTKEINLQAKETRIRIGKTEIIDQKSIGISPKVLTEIEEIRKSHGRDIVFSRQESREARFSQNEKFVIVDDLYLDFIELADARDAELSGDPVETVGKTRIYNAEGNLLCELARTDGWQPVLSNSGEYLIVTIGDYEKHRILNLQKEILAEMPYHNGNKWFSPNDRFILLEDRPQYSEKSSITVYDTKKKKINLNAVVVDGRIFTEIESMRISEGNRTVFIKHLWNPETKQSKEEILRF